MRQAAVIGLALRRAPVAFLSILILTAAATWMIASRYYAPSISSAALKDEELQAYQQGLAEHQGNTLYKGLSNAELKSKAVELAGLLKSFAQKYDDAEAAIWAGRQADSIAGMPPAELHHFNSQVLVPSIRLSEDQAREYRKEFDYRPLAMREEILSRLDPDERARVLAALNFQRPTNAYSTYPYARAVAQDLETLAGSLK